MFRDRSMRRAVCRKASVAPSGISFVAGSSGVAGANLAEDIALPAGLQENDIVFVLTGSDGGWTSPVGQPNTEGYTQLGYISDGNPSYYIGYKVMGSTPDTVVNIDGGIASGGTTTVCAAFRGVNTASPVAVALSVAGSTSGAPNPPSLNLLDGQMSVCFGVTEDDVVSDITAPTDWSDLVWRHDGEAFACQTCMIASRLISADGAYNPGTFTVGVTDDWDAGHFALAPAA